MRVMGLVFCDEVEERGIFGNVKVGESEVSCCSSEKMRLLF